MTPLKKIATCFVLLTCTTTAGFAELKMVDKFDENPANRWDYVADTVMGGVSSGSVDFRDVSGDSYARLSGRVSTENNGGFIQMRRFLSTPLPDNAKGIILRVRGNNERYFVHLRTSGTRLPWQYYQAGFAVSEDWKEIRIPFSDFKAEGGLLRKEPKPTSLRSVGIVAYGRDHQAEVEVSEMAFY
jgi:hypothetical protein